MGFKVVDELYRGWNDFTYKVGAVYDMKESPIICQRGFHFCMKPEHCLHYVGHLPRPYRCLIVKVLGDVVSDEYCHKFATNKIEILTERNMEDFVEAAVKPDDEEQIFGLLQRLATEAVKWQKEEAAARVANRRFDPGHTAASDSATEDDTALVASQSAPPLSAALTTHTTPSTSAAPSANSFPSFGAATTAYIIGPVTVDKTSSQDQTSDSKDSKEPKDAKLADTATTTASSQDKKNGEGDEKANKGEPTAAAEPNPHDATVGQTASLPGPAGPSGPLGPVGPASVLPLDLAAEVQMLLAHVQLTWETENQEEHVTVQLSLCDGAETKSTKII